MSSWRYMVEEIIQAMPIESGDAFRPAAYGGGDQRRRTVISPINWPTHYASDSCRVPRLAKAPFYTGTISASRDSPSRKWSTTTEMCANPLLNWQSNERRRLAQTIFVC